jgi:hypothetical protein
MPVLEIGAIAGFEDLQAVTALVTSLVESSE